MGNQSRAYRGAADLSISPRLRRLFRDKDDPPTFEAPGNIKSSSRSIS